MEFLRHVCAWLQINAGAEPAPSCFYVDGVSSLKDGKLVDFHFFRTFTSDDVMKVFCAIEKRLTKLLRSECSIRGYRPGIEEELQDMHESPIQTRSPKDFCRAFQSRKWSEIDPDKRANLVHCNGTLRWLALRMLRCTWR